MANISKANVVYFSGTGGTELAARTIYDNLIEKGIDAALKSISVNDKSALAPCDMMFFLYPVHAGDASEAVYQFIRTFVNVPVPMTDCVVLSVSAGGEAILNTAARSKVIRKLLKKGFKTVYEDMIVMPNNFVTAYSDNLSGLLLNALPIKIKYIVDQAASGVKLKKNSRIIDSFLRTVCEPFKLFVKLNGKFLKADDKCTGCGHCAQICPRGNIRMENSRPVFEWQCVMCMKCVYQCPADAIGNIMTDPIKVKGGYDIEKMKALAENIQFTEENILKETPEASYAAIRKYLLGALDIIKENHD